MTGAELREAVKTGSEIYELAKKEGWVDRLADVFRKKHVVLLLGATGTGKTNLKDSLTSFIPEVIHYMNRTTFAERQRVDIAGNPFIFIDTPGDRPYRTNRMNAIRASMGKGVEGIIDVVSYGYHEGRGGVSEALTTDDQLVPQYLEARRKVEIEGIGEWMPLLGGGVTASWVITAVSKADLWWDHSEDILKYYESGDYADALGDTGLSRAVIPYCSVIHRFYGKVPVCGSFDDSDRSRMRRHLLGSLVSAIGKGHAPHA